MTELNNPLISIVTPVYNREELIIKAIQSVENQTYQKWEYLIIDDGSTDKTWDTIQAYAQLNPKIIPYQREQQPKGAQTCRNLGLSKANGKYIIFLDSDDYLLSHCLEQRVNYLTNLLKINLAVFPEIKLQYTDIDNFLLSFLAYRLPLRIMDSMWETTFLKKIGGFNIGLVRFQDVELHIRALLVEDIEFSCSIHHKPDSVYVINKLNKDFPNALVVHDAIIQLIETVVPLLIKSNKEYLKSNMKYYLCSWLIHYDSKDSNHLSVHLSNFFLNKTLIPNILFKIITNLLPICKNQKISKTVKKIIFYTIFKIL